MFTDAFFALRARLTCEPEAAWAADPAGPVGPARLTPKKKKKKTGRRVWPPAFTGLVG
jgi:hypothetical protein